MLQASEDIGEIRFAHSWLYFFLGWIQSPMPKKSRNFAVLPFTATIALTTLGDDVVLTGDIMSSALAEDFYCVSGDFDASLRGLTAGQGDPMTVVIAHSDYTDTEIREALDIEFLGPGSKIEQERSRRLVREVGVLQQQGNQDDTFTSMNMIGKDGGRVIRQKIKWVCQSGNNALSVGVWNRSGGALATGSTLEISGKLYGRWLL